MSLLDVKDLTMRFGGLVAVNQVSFGIEPREVFSIIGPNGAGKTTVFNAITGIYEPTSGSLRFDGASLKRSFSQRTVIGIALIAIIMAVGFLCAFNLEEMWKATITANFIYQKPFPYGKAWSDLAHFLGNLPQNRLLIPVGLGLILGTAGSTVVWLRSRGAPNFVAERGIARTFQNIRLFGEMTVLENVLVGMDSRLKTRLWDMVFRTPKYWKERREATSRAFELLQFVDLADEVHLPARNLPYGHQRRLEIARALATKPKLLLLDEPAAGMNPSETKDLMDLIRKIRDTGIGVLLIEHHMRVVMEVSDRIVVLDYGNKIAEGTPEQVRTNPQVIEAYLGKEVVG